MPIRSGALALLLALALVAAPGCRREERTLAAAREDLEAGRFEEALVRLRDGLADAPDDAALNLAYGRALIASGQPSLAVWSLTKAGQDPALFRDATLLLAQAQIATNAAEGAVATLQTLLERDPDALDALRLMVEACVEGRVLDRALETLEHALDLAPDDLALEMSRMRVFLHLDRKEEAAEVLAAIRKKIPELEALGVSQREFLTGRYCAIEAMFTHESGSSQEARPMFERCLAEHPDHPQVVASATEFFDAIGEGERATAIQRAALDQDPERLERRVALAMRLTRLGEPAAAEALLRAVTGSQPGVWAALVDHYVDVEDPAKALEALEHAIEDAGSAVPGEWRAVRADLLIQTGRLDEAERAIEAIDEEVWATTTRGRLELARGRPREALALLEQGIRLWPDGTLARYLAAQAAEQLGDFERAEAEYREAYRSDQAYTDAGLQLAELLASRGLPADALTLSSAYLQSNPDDAVGYEQAIGYAIAARDGDMARTILVHYQRHPKLAARAAAFAVRELLRTGQVDAAVALAKRTTIDPGAIEQLELFAARGEAWVAAGRADEALAAVRSARAAAPDRLDLAELEADLLARSGAPTEAEAVYEHVRAASPRRATTLRALAALAAADGRKAQALERYAQAAEADPEDAESLVAAARLLPPGAERMARLREALRRDPRHGRAAADLAEALLEAGPAGASPTDGSASAPDETSALLERARRFGAGERADAVAARPTASDPTQP